MNYYKEYLFYCPRCGDTCFKEYEDIADTCYICGYKMIESSPDYGLSYERWDTLTSEPYTRDDYERLWKGELQKFHDEVVVKSPVFDVNLYNRRDEIDKQHYQEFLDNQARGQAILEGTDKGNRYGVRCPYCNATNVRKISSLSKAASLSFFGIFSMGKVNKQWHCTHCGSDF